MAEIVIMPKLGFNMDEGQLVAWHKKVGDRVSKGEALFDINTDKTTITVDATSDGVLLKTLLKEEAFVPVFTPIAVVGQAGEDADAALAAHAGTSGAAGGTPVEPQAKNADASAGAGTSLAAGPGQAAPAPVDLKLTPRAQRLVKEEQIDPASLAGVKGTGYQGGITSRDLKASPLAKRLADTKGVDLAQVRGSGVGGKVMLDDVKAAGTKAASIGMSGVKKVLVRTPYQGIRKIIGDRLAQSKFTAPHLYFTDSVDTTNLTECRRSINAGGSVKVAVSDLLILAAAKALGKFPGINASLENGEIVCYESANVGIAVAGDKGLIVPVVHEAQAKTLSAIATETRDLVERAKVGKLSPDEFSNGTFTISNLGMFGIENFTAIINPPEAAILSVSSVRKKVVVITDENGDDQAVIRPMMNIQLTVDHRLIDGLLAAQFLRHFKGLLENPVTMLL